MNHKRLGDLREFYSALDRLDKKIGGARTLSTCSARLDWPKRGVYFFRESGENRTDTGNGPRIVRVGTHALKEGAGTTLWTRLSQHKGQIRNGGGNHRGSIFRLIVGAALISQRGYNYPTWGDGSTADAQLRQKEHALECEVSRIIGDMPFLWLGVEDDAGPNSLRGYIERNSIALLSNYKKPAVDTPSQSWLGRQCNRERVVESGLWNSNHVDEEYDPDFIEELNRLVSGRGSQS